MPTYQYECDDCGHSFEIVQGIAEDKLRKCPKCNKLELYRLIGAGTGIIFKGSGFYETDYKSKSSVTGSSASGKSTDTKKEESKPKESKSVSESTSTTSE